MTSIIAGGIDYAVSRTEERHSSDPVIARRSYCRDVVAIVMSERFFLALSPRIQEHIFVDDSVTKILQRSPTFIYSPHIAIAGDVTQERLLEIVSPLICVRDLQLRSNSRIDNAFVVKLATEVVGATVDKFALGRGCPNVTYEAYLEIIRLAPTYTLRSNVLSLLTWRVYSNEPSYAGSSTAVALHAAGVVPVVLEHVLDRPLGNDEEGSCWRAGLELMRVVVECCNEEHSNRDFPLADVQQICTRLRWLLNVDLLGVKVAAADLARLLISDRPTASPSTDHVLQSGIALALMCTFGEQLQDPRGIIHQKIRPALLRLQRLSEEGEEDEDEDNILCTTRLQESPMSPFQNDAGYIMQVVAVSASHLLRHLSRQAGGSRLGELRTLLSQSALVPRICDLLQLVCDISKVRRHGVVDVLPPCHPALVHCLDFADLALHWNVTNLHAEGTFGDDARRLVSLACEIARLSHRAGAHKSVEEYSYSAQVEVDGRTVTQEKPFPRTFLRALHVCFSAVAATPFPLREYMYSADDVDAQGKLQQLQAQAHLSLDDAINRRLDALDLLIGPLKEGELGEYVLDVLRIAEECNKAGLSSDWPYTGVLMLKTDIAVVVHWMFETKSWAARDLVCCTEETKDRLFEAAAALHVELVTLPLEQQGKSTKAATSEIKERLMSLFSGAMPTSWKVQFAERIDAAISKNKKETR